MNYRDAIKGAKGDTELLRIAVDLLNKLVEIQQEKLRLEKIMHEREQRGSRPYPG